MRQILAINLSLHDLPTERYHLATRTTEEILPDDILSMFVFKMIDCNLFEIFCQTNASVVKHHHSSQTKHHTQLIYCLHTLIINYYIDMCRYI